MTRHPGPVLLLLVVAACDAALEPEVAGVPWRLAAIVTSGGTIDVAPVDPPPTLRFTPDRGTVGTVSGFGGCNTYSGEYRVSGAGRILIDGVKSTRIYCGGPDGPAPGMRIEQEFVPQLAGTISYAAGGDTLRLMTAAGTTLRFLASGR